MNCLKINYKYLDDHNFIYPILGLCGLFMTYLGNRFVRPTIFSLGTILSTGSSYKLTELIMEHFNYHNCLVVCIISLSTGFSGRISFNCSAEVNGVLSSFMIFKLFIFCK